MRGFLVIALQRPDVLLSADLALRKAIRRLYGLDHLPDEGEVLRMAKRWRPYRSLAVAYIFSSAFERPASGGGSPPPGKPSTGSGLERE